MCQRGNPTIPPRRNFAFFQLALEDGENVRHALGEQTGFNVQDYLIGVGMIHGSHILAG